ncbi:hypothetical protein GCM10029964_109070 [Kibdelosporangium lantanae]
MTGAEELAMTALPQDWLVPRADGWTLSDVQELPEGARVEVLDGALIVNPSPLPIHQRVMRRLAAVLEGQLPDGWQLETDVDVMLAENPLTTSPRTSSSSAPTSR